MFRGDVGLFDPESDLAGRDEVDSCLWLAGNVQSIGGMGAGVDVERLHPGEFTPLLLSVLVAADMFPCESEREPAFDLCNLVCHIALRAQCGACEGRSGGEPGADAFDESVIVCGDAQPGLRRWQTDGSSDVVESVEVNTHFEEDQQRELADAFRAKRVGKPPGGDAATLPEERGGCSDNPSKRSSTVFGAAVRAWK